MVSLAAMVSIVSRLSFPQPPQGPSTRMLGRERQGLIVPFVVIAGGLLACVTGGAVARGRSVLLNNYTTEVGNAIGLRPLG
jgi:hypothetical protein